MFKRISILLFVVTLIITVSSVFAKMMESKPPKVPTKAQRLSRIQTRVSELSKKLGLSEEQKRKIIEILNKSKDETASLIEETGLKINELKQQAENEIEKVLTDQQKEKFNKVYESEEDDENIVKVFKSSY